MIKNLGTKKMMSLGVEKPELRNQGAQKLRYWEAEEPRNQGTKKLRSHGAE